VTILFYDLETTGLPHGPRQPGICQIGAVIVDPSAWSVGKIGIVDEFEKLVNPELPHEMWEAGAMKVTGITPETVADAPSFFSIGKEFAAFAVGCEIMSGYNFIDFDNPILAAALSRYGMEYNFPWPPKHVDVAHTAKATGRWQGKRGPKFPKLTLLYEELTGEKLVGAHGALADARASAYCYKGLSHDT
jgi:DNA polymerase III epsilon subunit-like protein